MNHSPDDSPTTEHTVDPPSVRKRISFTSVPVLMTSIVLSATLLLGALFWWGALGKEIRDQVSWSQGAVWLFLVFLMLAILLSLGYSRVWADEAGVTVRNGPVVRKFAIGDVAGLRLRKGDPWAYLLVKNDGGVRKVAVLAIQAAEGNGARRKINELRAWLKANGATSKGIVVTDQ